MPWKLLSSWYDARHRPALCTPMPLTLVTLRGLGGSSAEEVAFYADAEFEALVGWAASGRFVMAFAALDRDELTLLCPDSPDAVLMRVNDLPLVAAGLATADVRIVASLRPTAHLVAVQ